MFEWLLMLVLVAPLRYRPVMAKSSYGCYRAAFEL